MAIQKLKGVNGVICWGYRTAATLSAWAVVPIKGGGFTLTGQVREADEFSVSRRPLQFVAPVLGGELRWTISALDLKDGAITATLGQLES